MRLVDQSPRLSRDLDSSELRGRPIQEEWVREALLTVAAKRVVLGIDRIVRHSIASIGFLVRCRSLTGGEQIAITVSVTWDEPLLLNPELQALELPSLGKVQVPVVHRAERAAEKVRAFMDRGEANDAHDLHWYATRRLNADDWRRLPHLIQNKFTLLRVPPETNLHQRFDAMRINAQKQWKRSQGLVMVADPPSWEEVETQLVRFKALISQYLPRP